MSVDNVSVSSVFAAADRGAIFAPPASYISETTLVSYTTTLSGSGMEKISGPASTYTTTEIFIDHDTLVNQDCYPETEGTKWDDTTAITCCPQNNACVGTALTGHQCATPLSSVWSAPTPTSGIPLEIPSQCPLVPYTSPKAMSALHAARDISTPAAAASVPTGLLTATGTPDFTPPSNSISIPASTPTPISSAAPPQSEGGHISTGSKLAIIIGIPLAVLTLFLSTYLLHRYRRRKLRRRHRVRHDLSSPAPTHFVPTTWTSNLHAGSRAHLVPAYKESVRSKVEGDPEYYGSDSQSHLIPVPAYKPSTRSKLSKDDPEDNAPEFYEHLQPPNPVYEAEARSIRSNSVKIVEIGPSKHEWSRFEGIVELADTSRKSVKEWARSVRSVRSSRTSRKSRPPNYEESERAGKSWFEDGPPSPAVVQSPVRGRFE